MPRLLIVGGTGRIGSALAAALRAARGDCEIRIGGRRREVGMALARRLGAGISFVPVDVNDAHQLGSALAGVDLVIHAAGPFQGAAPTVLDAAIAARARYLDIADDLTFAQAARSRHPQAVQAGVAALVNGGIFPGLSNVMAGLLIERGGEVAGVDFSYFVAGTGGAGPAVMASTFLLAGQPATEYVDGQPQGRPAFAGRRVAQFPAPVGRRACFRVELPEVSSCHAVYGVPAVSARFGTAPGLWNYNTRLVGRLPRRWVRNRRWVEAFVRLLWPLLRLVDRFVGAAIGMRVDVRLADGRVRTIRYSHSQTVPAIATAVAAQAFELLDGKVAPGVYWPEEGIGDKAAHLARAAIGATVDEGGE